MHHCNMALWNVVLAVFKSPGLIKVIFKKYFSLVRPCLESSFIQFMFIYSIIVVTFFIKMLVYGY